MTAAAATEGRAPAPQPRKPVAPPSPPRMLPEGRIKLAEHSRSHFAFPVPAEWTPQNALEPMVLSRRVDRFRVGDIVEMWNDPPDVTWWMKTLVISTDPVIKAVRLAPLITIDLTTYEAAKPDLSRAVIEEIGTGWRVRYGHNILIDQLASRAKAEEWLAKRANGNAGG